MRSRVGTGSARLYLLALALFVACTALFGVSVASFRDPTYVGHQLRELFTHALVTVPLALGACLVLAHRFAPPPDSGTSSLRLAPVVIAGVVAVACGAFLLVAAVLLGARSHGQKTGLAELLFPHFFEHSLGYAFVTSFAAWLWLRAPAAAMIQDAEGASVRDAPVSASARSTSHSAVKVSMRQALPASPASAKSCSTLPPTPG